MYQNYVKRILDIFLSVFALIVLAIPMLFIALLIKIDSPGPVIFKQERLGRNGKVYKMYKFRSMCIGAEHTGSGVYSGKNDNRVTKVGRIIRATSTDELPQLINIIKGDMSIIGFRSPLTYHPWKWEEYTENQKKMFEVRPGLSGWAQIHGRKNVEWNERIALNVWYAENVSFVLDVKILFLTIIKVIKNEDNESKGKTVKRQNVLQGVKKYAIKIDVHN